MHEQPSAQILEHSLYGILYCKQVELSQSGLAFALLGRAHECANSGACAWAATLLVVCIMRCAIWAISFVEVCSVKPRRLYAYRSLPLAAELLTWGGGVEL